MSKENVEIASEAFAARNRGDVAALLRLLTPDVVADASRRLFDPGVYTGHDGFVTFIGTLDEAWRDQQFRVQRMIATGEGAVALVYLTSTGRSSGLSIQARPGWVFVMRAGKIARMTLYQTWDDALEAVALRE